MRFAGQTVVVTGGGQGIGAATAARFAAEGAFVAIADIDLRKGRDTAAGLVEAGGTAAAYRLDAGESESWRALAAELHADGRIVDVVVNNAYVVVVAPAAETEEVDWERQLSVDLSAVYHSVRAFMADLQQARGSIVNVASVHAESTLPGHPAYAAAKGGVLALTRQLSLDYGPEVRVNAVLPGPILTHTWDTATPDDLAGAAAATGLARLGKPDEVASVIAFLASEDASYVNGAELAVDGGMLARLYRT